MQFENILTRPDKSRVKIQVNLIIDSKIYSRIEVLTCAPGKRTFVNVHNSDDYQFRNLPFGGPECEAWKLNQQLEHVSREELNKLLWECTQQVYSKIQV